MENFAEKPPKRHDKEEQENPDELTRRDFITGAVALGAITAATKFSTPEATVEEGEKLSELERLRNLIPEGSSVTVSQDEEGGVLFECNHVETKETLDFLSGRGEVGSKEIANVLRREFLSIEENAGVDIFSEESVNYRYSIVSEDDIIKFYTTYWEVIQERDGNGFSNPEEYAQAKIKSVEEEEREIRSQIHPVLYEKLWELYLECGAPIIERTDSYQETTKGKRTNHTSFSYRKNRIRLDTNARSDILLSHLVQEFAHSYSFYVDPARFAAGRAPREKFINDNSELFGEEMRKAMIQFYTRNGNEEHYAHMVLFPRLASKLTKFHPTLAELVKHEILKLQNQRNSIE